MFGNKQKGGWNFDGTACLLFFCFLFFILIVHTLLYMLLYLLLIVRVSAGQAPSKIV